MLFNPLFTIKSDIILFPQTFALPGAKISETQDRLWFLVKEAQEAALKAGRQGASGRDVDAAARDLIKNKGQRQAEREGFTHRLGRSLVQKIGGPDV